ncbi:MAG: fused MFS/spermidine synthase, partial [Candidatus Theseobacter exili]|nr:fused MFS/spermidine synthase [Candidatus Theseobacter exili]
LWLEKLKFSPQIKSIHPALILTGVTSISAQILFIRELFVLFYGNEIIIGFTLAIWLMWGALGSSLLARITDRISLPCEFFSWILLLGTLLIPLTIISIRAMPLFLGPLGNQLHGPLIMIFVSGVLLFPFCIINGLFFASGCHVLRLTTNNRSLHHLAIGKMYTLEAFGAVIGGIITGILLIKYLNAFSIVMILVTTNAIACFFLSSFMKKPRKIILAALLFLSLSLGFSFSGATAFLEKTTLKLQWTGYNLIASQNSPYGSISVTSIDTQRNFYQSGLLAFSVPDRFSSEEGALIPALQHTSPKNILIIGGDGGGVLKILLKIPGIEHVDYVELDPALVNISLNNVPLENRKALLDKRVSILNTDGRMHLKTVSNKYDMILIYLPDPYTAQINRFYTVEFYQFVANALKNDGVFSFSVTSSENYIGKELAQFLSSLLSSLQKVFPEVEYLPGNRCIFLASKEKNLLVTDPIILEKRISALGIEAIYIRDYYLKYRLSKERIQSFKEQLKQPVSTGIWINTDFHPISYYFDMIFWSAQFSPKLKTFILSISRINSLWILCLPIFALIVFLWAKVSRKGANKTIILSAIFIGGITECSLQIVVLIAFQIIYGSVYYKIGLIFMMFMLGTALGAGITRRKKPTNFHMLIVLQSFYIMLAGVLPSVLKLLQNASPGPFEFFTENILFPVLPALTGFVGGLQFPVAASFFLLEQRKLGASSGMTYGMDLAGAALGSLLISFFILPLGGVKTTCQFLVFINLLAILILFGFRKRTNKKT